MHAKKAEQTGERRRRQVVDTPLPRPRAESRLTIILPCQPNTSQLGGAMSCEQQKVSNRNPSAQMRPLPQTTETIKMYHQSGRQKKLYGEERARASATQRKRGRAEGREKERERGSEIFFAWFPLFSPKPGGRASAGRGPRSRQEGRKRERRKRH